MLVAGAVVSAVLYVEMPEADESVELHHLSVSKSYLGTLQRYGGKAAVLFDEVNRWFAGLWEGKALAGTVLVLTLLVAGTLFVCGRLQRGR